MFVCCESCVLSGRGLCDELITRPEESYRLWCVVVCDLETSRMRRPWPALGRSATEINNKIITYLLTAIEFSLGVRSSYTSTCKTNKNKYNVEKQSGNEADRIHNMKERMSFLGALLPGIFQRQCRFHHITPMVIVQYCSHWTWYFVLKYISSITTRVLSLPFKETSTSVRSVYS